MEEQEDHLGQVLRRITYHNLKVKITNCSFCQKQVELLGLIISKDGVSIDPKQITTIAEVPRPNPPTELGSFLGLCGYYRNFVRVSPTCR